MINNRQSGRRRGRGGGTRPPGSNPGPGNRQDNRQRGNAAQLLEKYKGLARDAQMQGDRVQTEYYLQYADHYFRVLSENRSRYEEQRRQRGEDDGAEDEGEDDIVADANEADEAAPPRRERTREREDRGQRNGEYRARRPRAQRDEETEGEDEGGERIALDSLPPAIAPAAPAEDTGEDVAEEKPVRAPRRRTVRRPRATDEDSATAA